MIKNFNFEKFVDTKNVIKQTNNIKTKVKKNIPDCEMISKKLPSNIKKGVVNKFNDQSVIVDGFIPKWVLEQIAKYPKGTFKRVNRIMEIDGKMHRIVYEGVKVDFDVTAEGLQVVKQKMRLF